MKSKLVVINLVLILVNIVVTLTLLDYSTLEYASYSEYVLMASYVGIFSLGMSAAFQRKVVDRKSNYSPKNVMSMFFMLTAMNLLSFTLFYKALDLSFWFLIIVITYNSYYLSKSLLSLSEHFVESKILELLERSIFLIIILVCNDINKVILFDILLKCIFATLCYIRTAMFVSGDTIIYTSKDYIDGMLLMAGNWLLIVALNLDKQAVLSVGMYEFGTYSVALSLFVMLNSLILPLRIYYYSNYKSDPTESLNMTSILLVITSVVGVNILLELNIFPEKESSLYIFKSILFLLPLYIQININLINQMQIYKSLNFAVVNLIVVLSGLYLREMVGVSLMYIIGYKFIILILIYIFYMMVLKKKGIINMLLITTLLFIFQNTILVGLIGLIFYYLYCTKFHKI